MTELFTPRLLVLAFLSWLIPFVASFAFFGPGGVPWVPYSLFKSLMVVIFGGVGLLLMLRALRGGPVTVSIGLAIGLLFLVVNVVLDVVVLLPMTGMGFVNWLYDIGLRYLLIPIMGWGLGRAGEMSRAR